MTGFGRMAAATAVVLGTLAVLTAFVVPTGGLLFGVLALAVGALAWTQLPAGSRATASVGAGLGAAAIVVVAAIVIFGSGSSAPVTERTSIPAPSGS
jgi:hypothetical protein